MCFEGVTFGEQRGGWKYTGWTDGVFPMWCCKMPWKGVLSGFLTEAFAIYLAWFCVEPYSTVQGGMAFWCWARAPGDLCLCSSKFYSENIASLFISSYTQHI